MREQVLGILRRNKKLGGVTPESDLLADFGLTSLEIAEIVYEIEEALDIEIPPRALNRMRTVGDLCAYVDTL